MHCLLQGASILDNTEEVQRWQNGHEDCVYVAKSRIEPAEMPQHKEPENKGLEVIAVASCA